MAFQGFQGFQGYRLGRLSSPAIGGGSSVLSQLGTNGAIPVSATFTRTGTAWAIGSDGGVDSYAQDTPRYQYDLGEAATGLLIEGARTNLVTYSNYDAGAWLEVTTTVTAAFGIAPDGTSTSFEAITTDPSSVNKYIYEPVAISTADLPYSGQAFIKQRASTNEMDFSLWLAGGTQDYNPNRINLNDGTLTFADIHDDFIIEQRASWWRIAVVLDGNSGANNSARLRSSPDRSGGTSVAAEYWNFQLEQAAFPSSPIITNGSTVTRNAETCTDSIASPPSEITLTANGVAALGTDGNQTWLQADDGTDNNRVVIRRESTGNVWARRYSGGVLQSSIDLGAVANGANALVEAESTASTFRARINGGTILTNNTGTHPSGLDTVRYGSSVAGEHMFGVLLGSDQATGTKVQATTLVDNSVFEPGVFEAGVFE